MFSAKDRVSDELKRLERGGPEADEPPLGIGVFRFFAPCPRGAGSDIALKVRAVLRLVDEVALSGAWLSDEAWEQRLPEWFTSKCSHPRSQPVALRRLAWLNTLSGADLTAALDAEWSVAGWVHWFKLDSREWYWWDAQVDDSLGYIVVDLNVDDWPYPWEALRWLFVAAGASDLFPKGEQAQPLGQGAG